VRRAFAPAIGIGFTACGRVHFSLTIDIQHTCREHALDHAMPLRWAVTGDCYFFDATTPSTTESDSLGDEWGSKDVIDLLILILLATTFASAVGYVGVCSRLVGQRSPPSDKAL
jgi:hypothetical protein